MFSVAPAICEKIRRANFENNAFVFPNFRSGNLDASPIPANFVTRDVTVIGAIDFKRISENAGGIIIFVTGSFGLSPRRERFPAKRDDDLLAPIRPVGQMPTIFKTAFLAVETKLPGAIEVEPIFAFDCAALKIRARILRSWINILSDHTY